MNILSNYLKIEINPQNIQNAANALWDNASQYVNDNINIPFKLSVRETVSLGIDIGLEDRIFLQNSANRELNSILTQRKCKINLNLPNVTDSYMSSDSSQVFINGPPEGVLESYLEIRELLPITVWFDLKLNPSLPSIILDPNSKPLISIQKKLNINIAVVPMQITNQTMLFNQVSIYIRTNRKNECNLQSAIEELFAFVENNNYGNIYPKIQTKIDVPSNQPTIVGRSYSMIEPLAAKTSTQISVQRSASNLMSNVSIAGLNYTSVRSARNEISDRFVVELSFNVTGYQSQVIENYGRELERLGELNGVHILMKPNAVPTNKTMIIKGTDKDTPRLFEVRKCIVKLIEKPTNMTPLIPNGTPFD